MGEHEEEIPEVRIELPLNAHLPHDYVPDERLRLMAYTTWRRRPRSRR